MRTRTRRGLFFLGIFTLLIGGLGAAWLNERPLAYGASAPVAFRKETQEILVGEEEVEVIDVSTLVPEDATATVEPEALVEAPVIAERTRTPRFTRTENYLLIGVDHTRGNAWGRADSLVVAVFDDESGHVGVVSIPRDLFVEIPEHGAERINAVLRIGTLQHRDPLELAARVVSDTLQIPIEHVVVADLEAFERTVDALGGVDVDVPCPIVDDFIDTRTETGRRVLRVEAGRQHMDGPIAAMYVRSRHGRSDMSRARRQQAVLIGLRNRIRGMNMTEWVPVLNDALESGVTTTMSRLEMINLARRLASVESSRLHGILLGHREVEPFRTPEGQSVLIPRYDAVDSALARLFDAPTPGVQPQHARCQDAEAALRGNRHARNEPTVTEDESEREENAAPEKID